jgi:hypothetical protein
MKSIPDHDEVELVEQQLFRSLSRDEPPVKAKHVAAAALGLGSAALTSATAAEGAAVGTAIVKAGPIMLLKWVGIGTVAGVASMGAVRYATAPVVPAKPVAVVVSPAPVVAPVAPRVMPAPLETATLEPPVVVAPVAQPRVARSAPVRTTELVVAPEPAAPVVNPVAPPPDPPAPATSTLAAEVALLDQARGAVAAKSGERALDVLGRYTRQFPSGTLALEASVLRIEALFLTGSPAATTLANEFLAAHPSSTHATHVRRLLADHAKP